MVKQRLSNHGFSAGTLLEQETNGSLFTYLLGVEECRNPFGKQPVASLPAKTRCFLFKRGFIFTNSPSCAVKGLMVLGTLEGIRRPPIVILTKEDNTRKKMNMREKILLVAIFMGAFNYSGNFVSWFKAWELGA